MQAILNSPIRSEFLKRFLALGLLALVAVLPFHTVLVVWATRNFGAIYVWNAWKEVLLILISGACVGLIVRDKKLKQSIFSRPTNRLIGAYILLNTLYFIVAGNHFRALVGLAFNLRFLLIFILAQVAVFYMPDFSQKLKKLILTTGLIVAGIALLLHFLPVGILTHLGYDQPGTNTFGIPPAFHLVAGEASPVRAQSTLRGPNVFGALLILPLVILLFRIFDRSKREADIYYLAPIIMGIVLSYSRSAWLGALLAAGLVGFFVKKIQMLKLWAVLAAICIFVVGASVFMRQNYYVKAIIFHESITQTSVTEETSNEGHIESSIEASAEVSRKPFGSGLGTAGPVSVIDGGQAKVAENYFLQIFQETGWLGSLLLIAIHGSLGIELWRRRRNQYASIALVAFVGLVLTNFLLHTWADEVVALTFWCFAGVAIMEQKMIKQKS